MTLEYIKELLQSKVDIKIHLHNDIKKCRKFLNLCYKLGIFWNGDKPNFTPSYIFVTKHVKGYRLTYTNDTPLDIGFYRQHEAKEIKI